MVFGESLIITMVGASLGIVLTFPAAGIFGKELSQFFPIFHVENGTIVMDIIAALVVACVAGVFPTWRAVNIRIADGLRRIG
jgi:putative ABC transport system permease protein